jgi:uncharacterized protein
MRKRNGNSHILIFTRYPTPGKVKTRLIPALGPERAARLHRRMTEHAVAVAREARKVAGALCRVDITVCSAGASKKEVRAWLGTDIRYASQSSGELGDRMQGAFKRAFGTGAAAALLMGTDLPDVTSEILLRAMEGLKEKDIVLGRAVDGGYYLIGMKALHPALFEAKDWGSDRVYDQTRGTISSCGWTLSELTPLVDVDRPEDLDSLRNDPRFEDVFAGRSLVSTVVPTLNEAANIGGLLERLARQTAVECIVADGGSRDDTCKIAARNGAVVLDVSGGRATQQNAGASIAKGRLLLFLHADTQPPHGFADRICEALERPSIVAGAFQFKTNGTGAGMRWVERLTNLRSTFLQYPYGDQGLFLEKRIFHEMGGFAPLPIMEDFELVRRLRRRGTVLTLPHPAVTSAKRWQQLGVLQTTVINQIMILGFLCGVPVQTLQRFYRQRGIRRRHPGSSSASG